MTGREVAASKQTPGAEQGTGAPSAVPRSLAHAGFSLLEILLVVALIGVVSAVALPMMSTAVAGFRLSGDARGVSNSIALARIRAASDFTRARLYVDLAARTHHIESWNKTTNSWTVETGSTSLSTNSTFSFGAVATAPPNTQAAIGQAQQCTDNAGAVVNNTACVMFNSRGLPIDNTFAITPSDAVYVTDGTAVFGVTVAPTGMTRMWRTPPNAAPNWSLQ